jgi:hypothetical protein
MASTNLTGPTQPTLDVAVVVAAQRKHLGYDNSALRVPGWRGSRVMIRLRFRSAIRIAIRSRDAGHMILLV